MNNKTVANINNSTQLLKTAVTKEFKRDFKKLSTQQALSPEFTDVMYRLQRNLPLPEQYCDHALQGDMKGYRDCHIFSDLVLIYRIEDGILKLVRINTHSEIFG